MNIHNFKDKKDIIVFLVGCFSTFYISVVGRVYVGELIVFIFYIFYPKARSIHFPKELKRLTKFMWLWLFSAVLSDLYRQTPLIDCAKGVISQLLLIALVPFVYWALHDKISRWFHFFLGSIISSQLTYYLLTVQTEFGSTDIWRVYSYGPLFSGLAIILYWKGKYLLSYSVFLVFGIWILFGGSRNVFLTSSMTMIILYAINKLKGKDIITRINKYQRKLVVLFFAIIIGLFAINFIYENLASSGALGVEAYEKYNKQKNSDQGLASGRIEAFIAADLVSKSPIIGYGSFAKDRTNYVYNYYTQHNLEIRPGAFEYDIDSIENMLPRHSRIFGMWMWHGIGAGIFWVYILTLFYKTFISGCLLLEPKILALSVFSLMTETWDTFFSIMSVRLGPLFFWVFLILIYQQYLKLNQSTHNKHG